MRKKENEKKNEIQLKRYSTLSFDRKSCYEAIKTIKYPLKIGLVGIFFILGIFGVFSNASAETIFEDNFETYNLGDLDSQGNWEAIDCFPYPSNNFQVITGENVFQGIRAVEYDFYTSFCRVEKTGNQISNGKIVYYLKLGATSTSESFVGTFLDSGGNNEAVRFYCSTTCAVYYYDETEWVKYRDITDLEYHFYTFYWYGDLNKYQIQMDNFSPSPLYTGDSGNFSYAYKMYFNLKGEIYFDYIVENLPCEIGYCSVCGTYDECVNAGCIWYHTLWPLLTPSAFCVEPYELEQEECGSFLKCQYCLTQETCETELNCEWKDIGFGEKCYMEEPLIPPEQVSWEAPDCEAFEGFEKFICEAFMPSQEKIDILYQTIGAMKQKFPFNYLNGFTDFFSTIKNSLNSTTTIPFKMLGNEGEVDFTFWEATTTIGGVPETFKNIVKVFTSTIIIIVWCAWIIGFVKRIL